MDRETIAALYENDAEAFNVDMSKVNRAEFEDYELLAIESFPRIMAAFEQELKLLEEQYPNDKEVRYVLETVDIEGLWYTMLHKFDVGSYLGFGSTSAKLAKLLKGCDMILSDLVDET
jgi:hypothetical protein